MADLRGEQLVEIYRFMVTTRRLEEHLVALYRQNKVVGGVYRSLGQEATAVGCGYALRPGDIMSPLIRDLGALLVHGVDPLGVFRQYMARASGPSGGRDLNVHFSAPRLGILGPVSMLGAMIPGLCGCLLAARLLGEKQRVGLAFIGDGGSSTGAFYEGVNLAVVQSLGLIVVVEANHYAYSTATQAQLKDGDLVRRARGFGTPVYHVDGNDVLSCYEATREARKVAVGGGGPSIIVAETYRRRGHAEHDNQAYVPAGEVDDWAQHNDPLDRYAAHLSTAQVTAETLNRVREEVEQALNRARDIATGEDFPPPSNQRTGVFAGEESPIPAVETWFCGGAKHRGAGGDA